MLFVAFDGFKDPLWTCAVDEPEAAVSQAATDFEEPACSGCGRKGPEQRTVRERIHIEASVLIPVRFVFFRDIGKAIRRLRMFRDPFYYRFG